MAKPTARNKSPKRRSIRTDRARAVFIETLRETCNVSEAARTAGVGRRTVYDWKDADAEFSAAWEEAEAEAVDNLEGVVYRRAMAGESDRLAEILLKAHRPEKYVERYRAELTGKDGGPVEYRNLSEEEINARLAALAEKHGPLPLAD
jgi:transposase